MEELKKGVFNFVWAAGIAFAMVWLLMRLNIRYEWTEWLFFPSVLSFFASHGWSAKITLFFMLFLLNWLTGLHRFITGAILAIIFGIIALIVAIFVIYYGWGFLCWLASLL